MRPSWGIREGKKPIKTAGAGSQAGVEPVGWWILFLTGGGSNEVPWLGLAKEGCLSSLDCFPSGQ